MQISNSSELILSYVMPSRNEVSPMPVARWLNALRMLSLMVLRSIAVIDGYLSNVSLKMRQHRVMSSVQCDSPMAVTVTPGRTARLSPTKRPMRKLCQSSHASPVN